jgi:SAM-dependent methyltransferase
MFVDLPTDQEEMLDGQLRPTLRRLLYGRCRACSSLIAIDDRREPDRLAAIYRSLPQSYWNHLSRQDKFGAIVEQRLLQRTMGGDLWDVGCGAGTLLAALGGQWIKHGIEPGHNAVAQARTNGFDIHAGTAAELNQISVADVVTLIDVIEHMPEPGDELRAIYKMLKPGGHLLVFTGDANSLTARIAGKQWYYLQCIGHVTVFSAFALERVLAQIGFVNVETDLVDHQGATRLGRWIRRILGNGIRTIRRQPLAPIPYFRDHKLVLASKLQ